ncbi:sugar phosphate isomerase/epimerase family protein [Dethiothermospora halolimnae]|uniref:sugar phosphate isomerase/epimerase family protein n=1 Tax=Dethiothermospora halolimnae TaxID=3114390 RepID=UPI003CCBD603
MTEYSIGMHGFFDDKKYKRDFRNFINGIEFCLFSDEEVNKLKNIAKTDDFNIGIHFPLRKKIYKYRDPLILSKDKDERLDAFNAIEKELKFATDINAKYMVMHFPKPVILNDDFNFDTWAFTYDNEFIFEKDYSFEDFRKDCINAFEKLSRLSDKYNVQIVLEHDYLNKYFYEEDLLENLLKKYTNIKLCLDTGRLHVMDKVNPNFDSIKFVQNMAKYTYLLHISNVRVRKTLKDRHFPVLPNQNTKDGWANIDSYLKIMSNINPNIRILFEHRSDLVNDKDLDLCYKWVRSYFEF